jgi:hypothetical protein
VSNRWFSTKSWSANSYIPDHEVGNIFSYKRYPALSGNANVASLIKGTYDYSVTLDAHTNTDWDIRYSDFSDAHVETEKTIGTDVSVGFSFFGLSFGGEDNYTRNSVSTHSTSVTQNLLISTHLDAIDMGVGEVRYTVTPYSYWATNGALVVDYAVEPELAQPGYTPTWWQEHYDSIPDLAFILPWRLDPEKGFTLQENAKRWQTNDIIFSKGDPKGGDTIGIRARIHNYSLAPTSGTVAVRFYVGDPDSGGTPITGLNGETELQTSGILNSREDAVVEMLWKIPPALGQFPRIYGKIDPENAYGEVHKENNKGFSVLGKTQTGSEGVKPESTGPIPETYALGQNYPNPFNPSTTIAFDMPRAGKATIIVYDILGREVATLLDQDVQAGSYRLRFNATGMPSGVYFYRMTAGGFSETRKIVLMR